MNIPPNDTFDSHKESVSKSIKDIQNRYHITTTNELEMLEMLIKIDNEDRKDDAQRQMTWFALSGMLLYPCLIVFCDIFKLHKAMDIISTMSDMYFVSISAIIMTFFGANALTRISSAKSGTNARKE